ncbi:DUF2442 domain-containing protein [Duganella sp.]|uniref:DUF2442 domain-containing protein n=1 Tax=Duganella sp. TaxID=1904440 RepID=UPI0031D3A7E6
MHGARFSHPVGLLEVTAHGFWIDLGNERLYAAYTDFPWFAGANAEQLGDVQRPSAGHLYWPALDIDLSVASLRDPAAYPLIANT